MPVDDFVAYLTLSDGEVYFNEEAAIAELLADGVLFLGGGYQSESQTLELFVICNDLFWWGTADAEPCKPEELKSLYDAHRANEDWGSEIWCCKRRGLQPQKPVREAMKKEGAWTDELAELKDPGPS